MQRYVRDSDGDVAMDINDCDKSSGISTIEYDGGKQQQQRQQQSTGNMLVCAKCSQKIVRETDQSMCFIHSPPLDISAKAKAYSKGFRCWAVYMARNMTVGCRFGGLSVSQDAKTIVHWKNTSVAVKLEDGTLEEIKSINPGNVEAGVKSRAPCSIVLHPQWKQQQWKQQRQLYCRTCIIGNTPDNNVFVNIIAVCAVGNVDGATADGSSANVDIRDFGCGIAIGSSDDAEHMAARRTSEYITSSVGGSNGGDFDCQTWFTPSRFWRHGANEQATMYESGWKSEFLVSVTAFGTACAKLGGVSAVEEIIANMSAINTASDVHCDRQQQQTMQKIPLQSQTIDHEVIKSVCKHRKLTAEMIREMSPETCLAVMAKSRARMPCTRPVFSIMSAYEPWLWRTIPEIEVIFEAGRFPSFLSDLERYHNHRKTSLSDTHPPALAAEMKKDVSVPVSPTTLPRTVVSPSLPPHYTPDGCDIAALAFIQSAELCGFTTSDWDISSGVSTCATLSLIGGNLISAVIAAVTEKCRDGDVEYTKYVDVLSGELIDHPTMLSRALHRASVRNGKSRNEIINGKKVCDAKSKTINKSSSNWEIVAFACQPQLSALRRNTSVGCVTCTNRHCSHASPDIICIRDESCAILSPDDILAVWPSSVHYASLVDAAETVSYSLRCKEQTMSNFCFGKFCECKHTLTKDSSVDQQRQSQVIAPPRASMFSSFWMNVVADTYCDRKVYDFVRIRLDPLSFDRISPNKFPQLLPFGTSFSTCPVQLDKLEEEAIAAAAKVTEMAKSLFQNGTKTFIPMATTMQDSKGSIGLQDQQPPQDTANKSVPVPSQRMPIIPFIGAELGLEILARNSWDPKALIRWLPACLAKVAKTNAHIYNSGRIVYADFYRQIPGMNRTFLFRAMYSLLRGRDENPPPEVAALSSFETFLKCGICKGGSGTKQGGRGTLESGNRHGTYAIDIDGCANADPHLARTCNFIVANGLCPYAANVPIEELAPPTKQSRIITRLDKSGREIGSVSKPIDPKMPGCRRRCLDEMAAKFGTTATMITHGRLDLVDVVKSPISYFARALRAFPPVLQHPQ